MVSVMSFLTASFGFLGFKITKFSLDMGPNGISS